MKSNYSQKLIEKYLEGRLTDREKKKFEHFYNTDSDFKEEVDFERDIADALENEDIVDFRRKISQTIRENKKQQYLNWFNQKTMKYAALFVIALVLGVGAFSIFEKNYTTGDLFNQYYSSEEVNISRSRNANIVEAVSYYQSGNYYNAIDQFNKLLDKEAANIAVRYYLGVSYIETKNYKKAVEAFRYIISDQENLYIENAEWYLGLCYLKNDELDKAVNQFTIISQSEDHYYSEKAKNLLSKINEEY